MSSSPDMIVYPVFPTEKLQTDFAKLSLEQQYAFMRVVNGRNLFLTGPGGTGKTRFIQYLCDYLSVIYPSTAGGDKQSPKFQVCALTGCAAVLLNCHARTIHSWSGIRLGRGSNDKIVQYVLKSKQAVSTWKSVKVLIIDEISMMSHKILALLDQIGRAARRRMSEPFGGIQLIFTGDFFQLPPVSNPEEPLSDEFCFQYPKWGQIFAPEDHIELKTMFRQTDPQYVQILQEVRRGRISEENKELLETRVDAKPTGQIVPAKLYPTRAKANFVNSQMYNALDTEEVLFSYSVQTDSTVYVDTNEKIPFDILHKCQDAEPEWITGEIDKMLLDMRTEKTIALKVGATVMLTDNLAVENGICNGSQGIIIGFVDDPLGVSPAFPKVRFTNGKTLTIMPIQRQSEEYPTIVVSQLPLCLAWALTIHKIQGATLDMAEMDIGKSIFEYGQSYVALSRVKTLEGLFISEFNPLKIRANPIVVDFYDTFPQMPEAEIIDYIGKTKMRASSFHKQEHSYTLSATVPKQNTYYRPSTATTSGGYGFSRGSKQMNSAVKINKLGKDSENKFEQYSYKATTPPFIPPSPSNK